MIAPKTKKHHELVIVSGGRNFSLPQISPTEPRNKTHTLASNGLPHMTSDCTCRVSSSVVLVRIRQILLVIVLFLERILESSLVLVLVGSNTCK